MLFFTILALALLAMGLYCANYAREAFQTGRIYPLTIVFGDAHMIQKDMSPGAYWFTEGYFFFGGIMLVVLGVLQIIGNIIQYNKKLQRKRTTENKPIMKK